MKISFITVLNLLLWAFFVPGLAGASEKVVKRVSKQEYGDWEQSITLKQKAEKALRAKLTMTNCWSRREKGKRCTETVTGMEFVWVPEGCFQMGSNKGNSDEKPVHEVCVDGFWMGKYEVSNEQYRRYKTSHDSKEYKGYNLNGDQQPAVNLSWDDARAYAKWVTKQGEGRFRLPTEAEWEYAARAGRGTVRYWGDDPDKACCYSNVADQSAKREWSSWSIHDCDDGYKVTATVGSFRANGFGLYDMLGNAWEWVGDWYNENTYRKGHKINPQGSISGARRVLRGGSWGNRPAGVRTAYRGRNTPDFRGNGLGFRLARTDP